MMAAEAGASRHTLAAYRNDLERAAETLGLARSGVDGRACRGSARSGPSLRRRPWPGARRRCGASSASWSTTAARATIRRRRCRGRGSSGRCRGSSTTDEVERDVRGGRGPGGERRAGGACATSRLLELLYGSGLRATELVSLPRGAVRPGQPFLMVRGKGDKERLVPISSRAEAAVASWLEHVPGGTSVAVPERQVASQPGAAVPDRPRDGRRRRHRARAGQPARPAPRLRHPPAVGRRRPARAAVAARPCRHRDDANLHPCRQRAAGRAGQHPPSARDRAVVDARRQLRLPARRQC